MATRRRPTSGSLSADRPGTAAALGTEATRLLVAHGLGTVGLRTITLSVLATNRRAQRAYDKAGFFPTGERWEDDATWVLMEIDRP